MIDLLLTLAEWGALWLLLTVFIAAIVLVEGEKREKRRQRDAFRDVSDRERVRTLAWERSAQHKIYPESRVDREFNRKAS